MLHPYPKPPLATSGGDTGNKHHQRQRCGCNEKRESYKKTLREEKTRLGCFTSGGGGGVGLAEAMEIRPWI